MTKSQESAGIGLVPEATATGMKGHLASDLLTSLCCVEADGGNDPGKRPGIGEEKFA